MQPQQRTGGAGSRGSVPVWDGPWLALWPFSMLAGVCGTALVYRSLMDGRPGFWSGLGLLTGGLLLSSRWVAQARRLQRACAGRAHRL